MKHIVVCLGSLVGGLCCAFIVAVLSFSAANVALSQSGSSSFGFGCRTKSAPGCPGYSCPFLWCGTSANGKLCKCGF